MSIITLTDEDNLRIEQERQAEIQSILKEIVSIDESIDQMTAN